MTEKPRYAIDDILNVAQAAEYVRVSEPTLRAYCHLAEGVPDRVPHFRMGTSIRIPFWGLLQWISRRAGVGLPSYERSDHRKMRSKPRRLTRRR